MSDKPTSKCFPVVAGLIVFLSFVLWSYSGQVAIFGGAYDNYTVVEVGKPLAFAEVEVDIDRASRLFIETLTAAHSIKLKPLGIACNIAVLAILTVTTAIAATWLASWVQPRLSLATGLGIMAFCAIELATRWNRFVGSAKSLYQAIVGAELIAASYGGLVIWAASLVACIVVSNLMCGLLQRCIVGRKTG